MEIINVFRVLRAKTGKYSYMFAFMFKLIHLRLVLYKLLLPFPNMFLQGPADNSIKYLTKTEVVKKLSKESCNPEFSVTLISR